MPLVTLQSGQTLPSEAIGLAIDLDAAGWLLRREGADVLRVGRKVDAEGVESLTDEQRQAIRAHKIDLLRIVDTCEEIAKREGDRTRVRTRTGQSGHGRRDR